MLAAPSPLNDRGVSYPKTKLLTLAASGGTMTDHPGLALTNVRIKAIFWGTAWYHFPTPSAGDVLWAIETIFYSPYLSGLSEYRGIGNGSLDPNDRFVSFSEDVPNPFSEAQLRTMLKGMFDAGQLPNPAANPQMLFVVFTPPGVHSDDAGAAGFHNWMNYNGTKVPYAWIGNNGFLDYVSSVLSHEIVEACTHPTTGGIFTLDGSCGQSGACEIADYCYGVHPGGGTATLGGVWMQAYWSLAQNGCIFPRERSVAGNVVGNTSLIQGRFLHRGNFEMVAPLSTGGIAHYSRVNDDPALPWFGPTIFGTDVGLFDAVTMIQSNFTAGANVGNLEVVARWQGSLLFYWREDVPPYRWHGPTVLPLHRPGENTISVSGNPALIQGRFLHRGNFELVTPLADGGLAHYSRVNDDPTLFWDGPNVFAKDMGKFDAVTLVQSDFSSSGSGPGDLEVVALSTGSLFHYWREDAPPYRWHGPMPIPLFGHNARGYPAFVQSRFGPILKGYFQVVTPLAGGGLMHLTRDNNSPGVPWKGATVLGEDMGVFDAVSLVHSNFSDSPPQIGNLEIVATTQRQLFHYWRRDNTQIASAGDRRSWFGPWVVTNGA